MTMDEKESAMAAMVENLQRQDLDFIEEAEGIACLMDRWSMSQDQAAKLIGKSQSAVANKLRLLRHSDGVLQAIREGHLTERHARALLKLSTEPEKLTVIATVVQLGMSVAQTERYIDQYLSGEQQRTHKPNLGVFLNNINQTLTRFQLSGIPAISQRTDTEDKIVLTITIPK
jgi:ParB family chromosome partitioning protein